MITGRRRSGVCCLRIQSSTSKPERRGNLISSNSKPGRGYLPMFDGMVEAVMLAGLRGEVGRVLARFSRMRSGVMLFFGCHQLAADLDRRQLVLADAAQQDLLLAGRGVERPAPILLGQRNGKRPVLRPDVEGDDAVRLLHEAVRLLVLLQEVLPVLRVLLRIAGSDQCLSFRP